jgi:hypothetical protein
MHAAEIVEREPHHARSRVILPVLAESVRQASKAAHAHTHQFGSRGFQCHRAGVVGGSDAVLFRQRQHAENSSDGYVTSISAFVATELDLALNPSLRGDIASLALLCRLRASNSEAPPHSLRSSSTGSTLAARDAGAWYSGMLRNTAPNRRRPAQSHRNRGPKGAGEAAQRTVHGCIGISPELHKIEESGLRQSNAVMTARSASASGIRSCSSIQGPAKTPLRAVRSLAVRSMCFTEQSLLPGTARCFHLTHAVSSIKTLRRRGKLRRKFERIPYPASSQSPQYTTSDDSSQRQSRKREDALPEPNTANVPGISGRQRNTSRFSTTSTRGIFQRRLVKLGRGIEQSATGQPLRARRWPSFR